MDHLIQKCPFKTPNALYQIYRMPHSMVGIALAVFRAKRVGVVGGRRFRMP